MTTEKAAKNLMCEGKQPKSVLTYELVEEAAKQIHSIPYLYGGFLKLKAKTCEYVMCHKCRHIFSYEKKYGVCDVCGKRWGSDDEDTPFYFVNETGGTP